MSTRPPGDRHTPDAEDGTPTAGSRPPARGQDKSTPREVTRPGFSVPPAEAGQADTGASAPPASESPSSAPPASDPARTVLALGLGGDDQPGDGLADDTGRAVPDDSHDDTRPVDDPDRGDTPSDPQDPAPGELLPAEGTASQPPSAPGPSLDASALPEAVQSQAPSQVSGVSRVPAGARMTNSPIEIEPGTQIIGTYEIVEHINTGGMGEVYRGVNIHNDETVAIKVVLPALAHDRKILALFQKESTVLRRLAHDAIVRYEVFTIDPGISRPCLVMEYVDGQPLTDVIEAGPMPVPEVLRLLRRVASGLDTAHRAGVVHRDLSPDNVILPDGNVEHAKIIDFGIAKAATPGGGTLIGGQFAGKYGYVAPEQFGWYDGVVTGQADVYSLGLLAAAMARGAPLNMGDNLAEAVRNRTTVPDLSDIPEALRPLLTRMLQPDPADRAESMAEVLATVEALIDPDAVVLPRPTGSVPPSGTVAESVPPVAQRPGATDTWPGAPEQVQADPPDPGESPFGAAPAPVREAPPPAPARSRALPVLLLALVAVAGGGAWYAGVLPIGDPPVPALSQAQPLTSGAEQAGWINAAPPVDTCSFVQVAGPGAAPDTVTLRAFGSSAVAFNPMLEAFSEVHGYVPALQFTRVRDGQCSVLGFLSDVRALDAPIDTGGLSLRTDQATLTEGDTISGNIDGAAGAVTSLLFFEHNGAMQNLSHRVLRDDDTSKRFTQPDLTFHQPPDSEPGTSDSVLLVAFNSDRALDTINLIGRDVALPASELPNFWRFLMLDISRADVPIGIGLHAVPLPQE